LPKNEDGEFELILANRQLLSVFFIVVILLGVFFTMGYIVGRNSAPLVSDASSTPRPDTKALAGDAPTQPIDNPPAEAPPLQKDPIETAPQQAPAKAEPEPEPVKPTAKSAKAAKADTKSSAKASKAEPKPAAASNRVISGQMYLQLAATSQHEADIMVDVLRKKGFKSLAAEIEERPGTFRVLVGPVTDAGTTNQMRSDLQSAGFPGNAAIRRTF
jgi:cell division septation protein DedD